MALGRALPPDLEQYSKFIAPSQPLVRQGFQKIRQHLGLGHAVEDQQDAGDQDHDQKQRFDPARVTGFVEQDTEIPRPQAAAP